jgi:hypothetical protein
MNSILHTTMRLVVYNKFNKQKNHVPFIKKEQKALSLNHVPYKMLSHDS